MIRVKSHDFTFGITPADQRKIWTFLDKNLSWYSTCGVNFLPCQSTSIRGNKAHFKIIVKSPKQTQQLVIMKDYKQGEVWMEGGWIN